MVKLEIIADFLVPKSELQVNFVHRTATRKTADKILEKGFKYTDSFQKTTDIISDDMVYLKYWNFVRKTYGPFLILISFSRALIDRFQTEINDANMSHVEVQQLLRETVPYQNSNNDFVYVLPAPFIKGYMDSETGEIILNPKFNPAYTSDIFEKNLHIEMK